MGIFYIVATPIGNLKDIALRALETLKNVDYILCEDTRVTGKLLNHYEISKQMVSFNDFSEDKKTPNVIADLEMGKSVALVSDAGTPLISDPGYRLVRSAIHRGIRVESIPGASSIVSALVVSGLPPDKFTFLGYLPKPEIKRLKILECVRENQKNLKSTTIILEAPYRLVKTLESITGIFGDVEIVVCRELTKLHEEIRREKGSALINHFLATKPKGEFVVLF